MFGPSADSLHPASTSPPSHAASAPRAHRRRPRRDAVRSSVRREHRPREHNERELVLAAPVRRDSHRRRRRRRRGARRRSLPRAPAASVSAGDQGAADGGCACGDELARPVLQDENGDGIAGHELARRIVPVYAIAYVASGNTRTRARVGARDPRAARSAVDANLLSSCMRPYNISTGRRARH
jgi:hypothetical protein